MQGRCRNPTDESLTPHRFRDSALVSSAIRVVLGDSARHPDLIVPDAQKEGMIMVLVLIIVILIHSWGVSRNQAK